jgi:hypothetical protein
VAAQVVEWLVVVVVVVAQRGAGAAEVVGTGEPAVVVAAPLERQRAVVVASWAGVETAVVAMEMGWQVVAERVVEAQAVVERVAVVQVTGVMEEPVVGWVVRQASAPEEQAECKAAGARAGEETAVEASVAEVKVEGAPAVVVLVEAVVEAVAGEVRKVGTAVSAA